MIPMRLDDEQSLVEYGFQFGSGMIAEYHHRIVGMLVSADLHADVALVKLGSLLLTEFIFRRAQALLSEFFAQRRPIESALFALQRPGGLRRSDTCRLAERSARLTGL